MNNWELLKQELKSFADKSPLVIAKEIPYEGMDIDYDKTSIEKEKLVNKFLHIARTYLKDKDK